MNSVYDMETYDLLKCIDNALDEYGSSAKQALYLNIALKESASFEEVVLAHPDLLLQALRDVFDDSSEIVKRSIVSEIKKVFGLKKPSDSYELEEALGIACKRISGMAVVQVLR